MRLLADERIYDDINITSLLDLSFTLLVIFVIMATATVQGMQVDLPRAGVSRGLVKPATRAITITSQGTVYLDTSPVSLGELEQRLTAQKAETGPFPVVVRGDGDVPYQRVVDVLDLLARIQITTVGLATRPLVR